MWLRVAITRSCCGGSSSAALVEDLRKFVAKLQICLEDLRAACRSVYDVGACAVLRHDHRFNTVCDGISS